MPSGAVLLICAAAAMGFLGGCAVVRAAKKAEHKIVHVASKVIHHKERK